MACCPGMSAVWGFCAVLAGSASLLSGCTIQHNPPAPAATVELTNAQGSRIRTVMAEGVGPATQPPEALLPASGIRWSDLSRAVRSAGSDGPVHFGVAAEEIGSKTAMFELTTIKGWPGVLRARHVDGAVNLSVRIGPYPSAPAAESEARSVERQVHRALASWGRKPAVPPLIPTDS